MTSHTELRAFHVVAEAQSFSQAARDVGVSQSTLSIHVKRLEEASGQDLFERLTRGVRLTATGERLYEATRRLFEAEGAARSLLADGRAETGGSLRIAADGAVMPARALSRLRQTRPELHFTLTVTNSARVLQDIAEFRADLGITARLAEPGRFHMEPFSHAALELWLPQQHPLAAKSRVSLTEALAYPLVLRSPGSQTRAVLEANLQAAGLKMPQGIEVSQQDTARELVGSGFGLGFGSAMEPPRDPRVVTRPLSDAPERLAEYVVCLIERRRSPLVRAFLRTVQEIDWEERDWDADI